MILTFEIAGEKQIARELLRFSGAATDASPAFMAIGDLIIAETREQFASEGGHASGGWRALKASTLDRKRRLGLRLEILRATDTLLHSLTVKGDPNMIFQSSPTELVFGTRVPYAEYHQTGTRTMPRRRPLELTENARRESVKILQRYIVAGEIS